jgi:RND superfamily putative drug exporter
MPDAGARRKVLLAVAVVLGWLAVAGISGPFIGKLTSVQMNDNAAFLPASAEATKALAQIKRFSAGQSTPAIVVYSRPAGTVTEADEQKAARDAAVFATLPLAVPPVLQPIVSLDHRAIGVVVPLAAKGGGDAAAFIGTVAKMRQVAAAGGDGLQTYVTGPGGLLADFVGVFSALDTTLLLFTGVVVVVILLLVYRSPVLWIVPILCVGAAFGLAALTIYQLARHGVITLNGQSQGILTVLVFGAGTDYALLLISRYREELRRHEQPCAAMQAAMRGAAPAIVASAVTVVLALLCLLLSELNSNRSLGPVAAIGILATLATMTTFLPALLVLHGRWVFWPWTPRYGSAQQEVSGRWGRVAGVVGRRSRLVWVTTAVVLLALVPGLTQLQANGMAQTQSFTNRPDSVVGQDVLGEHFPAGAGSPALIVARAPSLPAVLSAARGVSGVDPRTVVPLAQVRPPGSGSETGRSSPSRPKVVDGMVQVQATLSDPADSTAAYDTVRRLRAAVRAVPGADALVGGHTAVLLDTEDTSRRDRNVIIPVVLVLIAVLLALLLRAVVAPLMLIASVVLSFAATLGLCGILFRHLFHFAGADTAYPLFAFVFLVALGIDYNIFLMTRIREETGTVGTRPGTLRGLALTGAVITSAGVVLAATFSVLAVLPLVFLVEIGVTVAIGVLLDTIVVRSLLVPAMTYDIGPAVWWPSRLARQEEPAERSDQAAVPL